jgi:hypothetical protein
MAAYPYINVIEPLYQSSPGARSKRSVASVPPGAATEGYCRLKRVRKFMRQPARRLVQTRLVQSRK